MTDTAHKAQVYGNNMNHHTVDYKHTDFNAPDFAQPDISSSPIPTYLSDYSQSEIAVIRLIEAVPAPDKPVTFEDVYDASIDLLAGHVRGEFNRATTAQLLAILVSRLAELQPVQEVA